MSGRPQTCIFTAIKAQIKLTWNSNTLTRQQHVCLEHHRQIFPISCSWMELPYNHYSGICQKLVVFLIKYGQFIYTYTCIHTRIYTYIWMLVWTRNLLTESKICQGWMLQYGHVPFIYSSLLNQWDLVTRSFSYDGDETRAGWTWMKAICATELILLEPVA